MHIDRAKIVAKAWKDPSYKKKLLTNPKAAFEEMGYKVPANVTLKVVEDDPNTYTFVLPPSPGKMRELSESEIAKIAGGDCTPCSNSPTGVPTG